MTNDSYKWQIFVCYQHTNLSVVNWSITEWFPVYCADFNVLSDLRNMAEQAQAEKWQMPTEKRHMPVEK